jgi:hypothetical protein
MTLISVKSKYGSCSGNCTGIIKINNTQIKKSVLPKWYRAELRIQDYRFESYTRLLKINCYY